MYKEIKIFSTLKLREKFTVSRFNRFKSFRKFEFCRSIVCVYFLLTMCFSCGKSDPYAGKSSVKKQRIFPMFKELNNCLPSRLK